MNFIDAAHVLADTARTAAGKVANHIDEGNKTKLMNLLPQDGTALAKSTICEQLGWDDNLYHKVRDQLINEGLAESSRGPGGALHRKLKPLVNPPQNSNLVPAETRKIVWERDGGRCAIKGCKTPTDNLTYDHIIPRIKHGSNNPDNVRILCKHHNASKGSGIGD